MMTQNISLKHSFRFVSSVLISLFWLTLTLTGCGGGHDYLLKSNRATDPNSLEEEALANALPENKDPLDDMSKESDGASDELASSDTKGVLGGHYDVDTAHQVYPLTYFDKKASGKLPTTDGHVHEYDNKFNVKDTNFFQILHKDLVNIQDQITQSSERFYILITNAELSLGAKIEINGVVQNAFEYQKALRAANFAPPKVFVLGNPVQSGDEKLSSLKFKFDANVLKAKGLIHTETDCVRENKAGLKGEYRNGALTMQAIAVGGSIDPATQSAALLNGRLLWENTIFWHRDESCYGTAEYKK